MVLCKQNLFFLFLFILLLDYKLFSWVESCQQAQEKWNRLNLDLSSQVRSAVSFHWHCCSASPQALEETNLTFEKEPVYIFSNSVPNTILHIKHSISILRLFFANSSKCSQHLCYYHCPAFFPLQLAGDQLRGRIQKCNGGHWAGNETEPGSQLSLVQNPSAAPSAPLERTWSLLMHSAHSAHLTVACGEHKHECVTGHCTLYVLLKKTTELYFYRRW